MMNFKNKIVVITGGAQGIGKCIADAFNQAGAIVCIIDIQSNEDYVGDIGKKEVLQEFVEKIINKFHHIDYLINNAAPLNKGISTCSYEEFTYALQVGVTAPFYLSKLFMPYFNEGACIINISSTRAMMSQAETESYTAAKGGISSLTHALAMSLANKVRVNTISPGWINNDATIYDESDTLQHPVGRIGKPEDIANMVLFLCSDQASFITGENITIDGGMTKQMIYHNDDGWTFEL